MRTPILALALLTLIIPPAAGQHGTPLDCGPAASCTPSLEQTFSPESPTRVSYTGGLIEAHPLQRYSLFLPPDAPASKPTHGYPVLVYLHLSAFQNSKVLDEVSCSEPDQEKLAAALKNGFAVVAATATLSRSGPEWPAGVKPGNLLVGAGLFHPPGTVVARQCR